MATTLLHQEETNEVAQSERLDTAEAGRTPEQQQVSNTGFEHDFEESSPGWTASLASHDDSSLDASAVPSSTNHSKHHMTGIPSSPTTSSQREAAGTEIKHHNSSQDVDAVLQSQAATHTGQSTSSGTDQDWLMVHPSLNTSRANLNLLMSDDTTVGPEIRAACKKIKRILDLRHSFMTVSNQLPGASPVDLKDQSHDHEASAKVEAPYKFVLDTNGVYQVHIQDGGLLTDVPTLHRYYEDLDEILEITSDGPIKSFAYRRLQYLEGRYGLYNLLNEYKEIAEIKSVPHRDFYNVRKVDTHVHHSACVTQKHLLRFIKYKMKHYPDDVVLEGDSGCEPVTLSQVFKSIRVTARDLSIDSLDMHAHTDSFHRFDKFNLKYNPVGQSQLREIFLKTDNYIKGRYLAEITKEAIADLEDSKYQMVEWRLSIYGRSPDEWDKLAAWVEDNQLVSPNVRWLIQIPRLFALYRSLATVNNFEEIIQNVFRPLFEVTQDPSSHPKLHKFLQRVVGFDSVDDESKAEERRHGTVAPKDWTMEDDPPYKYWIYFIFANMTTLNAWRRQRKSNTFVFRPHCGEAGDTNHLAAAILCCQGISHGITLRKVPLIQYVFYLDQIGIAMSPLSNNALFLTYDRNPFPNYFKQGLNVSLSTDDPLQFALTREPLIEEYSIAAQIYKLSAVDRCELAKNSVQQSGYELALKRQWLGRYCYLPGPLGNDISKTNVPNSRERFRYETLRGELEFIANFTEGFSSLERHFPTFANSAGQPMSASEVYESFQSPRQYYARGRPSSVPDSPNTSKPEQTGSS